MNFIEVFTHPISVSIYLLGMIRFVMQNDLPFKSANLDAKIVCVLKSTIEDYQKSIVEADSSIDSRRCLH